MTIGLRSLIFSSLLWQSLLIFAAYAADEPKISRVLCDQLVNAVPAANVAYQPGIDVEGHAVVPADLPGSQNIKMPQKLKIPLTIDLAKSLHLSGYPLNQVGAGTEAQIGVLTVEGNTVSFNGQPLSDAQQEKLSILCMSPD